MATDASSPLPQRPRALDRAARFARERPELVALAGVFVLGAVLRFATLGAQSYRYDEAVTAVRVIHPSLFTTISTVPNSESTPPLYYVLAWLWSRPFGVGEVGLRSLSALAGCASIIVVYLAAAKLSSRRAGVIAAALVAVNPVLIWFSQDARAYSLLFLLSSLSFLFFAQAWRAEDGRPRRGVLVAWAAVSALALATHYFAAFLVVPEAALLLIRMGDRRFALLCVAIVAAVGAALLPLALHQAANGHAAWVGREPLGARFGRIVAKLVGNDNGNEHGRRLPGPYPLAIPVVLALVGVALLVWLGDRRERRSLLPALAVAVAGICLTLLAAAVGKDYIIGRNMLPLFIPVIVIIAAGFAVRRAGLAGLAAAAALCLAGLAFTIEIDRLAKFQREDSAAVARQIGPPPGPRAIVTVKFVMSWPLRYYLADTSLAQRRLPPLKEVDVVGSLSAGRRATRIMPRAFRMVEQKQVSYDYILTRFVARRPAPVPLQLLWHGRLADGGRNAAVLVDGTAS